MDELIQGFSLDRVGKSGSRFDPNKARWFNHHYLVSKQAQAGHTSSRVVAVDGEARVAELARMLGGDRLSTGTAHAQSLLESGRS